MAKCILMSIKPKYVSLILNKVKTVEVRKRFPRDYVGWVYIYCTKNGDGLVYDNDGKGLVNQKLFPYAKDCPENHRLLNGKVVAKFWVGKVEEIKFDIACITNDLDKLYTDTNDENKLLKNSCLTKEQISSYLKIDGCFPYLSSTDKGYFSNGFAIPISQLEIFDTPKELNEFYGYTDKKIGWYSGLPKVKILTSLMKAPQSRQYIEVEE